jgi:hypothetical protein
MSLILSGTDGLSDVDGSAATPAIRGTDANTGMFFPAADTIAFSEGGVESMRLDSNGNLGVGTSSPAVKLDVIGSVKTSIDIDTPAAFIRTPSTAMVYIRNLSGINRIDSYNDPITATYPLQFNASQHTFFIADAERMRIDSSGNVGIGVTPSAWSTANSIKALQIPSGALWNFSTNYLYLGQNYYWNGSNRIYINTDGASEYQQNAGTHIWYTAPSGTAGTTATLSERMRITSAGELLIGRTSSIAALVGITSTSGNASINCGDAADGTAYGIVQICRAGDQPDNKFHLSFIRTGQKIAGMGFLDNSNTLAIQNGSNNSGAGVGLTDGATSWSTVSDERKKNIVGNVEDALAKLADWRTVYFKYKTDEEDTPQRVGLIAQDVIETLPEAVTAEDDELKTLQVRYTETVPLLVKAIQEQQAMIEELKAKVAALEAA